MTKWSFDMIARQEYERVCEENRELKKKVEQLQKMLGENIDTARTNEGVGQD
jgi:cell division septum initiation protein DivIVA|tara:strand:- start:636 stop:791 length:156 start_codon:yes stop_codon:yes gene_type:complete